MHRNRYRYRYDAATDIGINISRVREKESLRDTLILSPVHGQIDEDISHFADDIFQRDFASG